MGKSSRRQNRRTTRQQKRNNGEVPTPKYNRSIDFRPQTTTQHNYASAIKTHRSVIATGCAGTGKSYVPLSLAAQWKLQHQIDRIVLIRPLVAVEDNDLGYFKGTFDEKMAEWAKPATDTLENLMGKGTTEPMKRSGELLIRPLGYMRGATLDNSMIILDEAQNATLAELQMLTTRIGQGSTLVINGDTDQTDLGASSGLQTIVDMVHVQNLPVPVIHFHEQDIVRSEECAMWIKAFNRRKKTIESYPN